jgi:hypothetical protein
VEDSRTVLLLLLGNLLSAPRLCPWRPLVPVGGFLLIRLQQTLSLSLSLSLSPSLSLVSYTHIGREGEREKEKGEGGEAGGGRETEKEGRREEEQWSKGCRWREREKGCKGQNIPRV